MFRLPGKVARIVANVTRCFGSRIKAPAHFFAREPSIMILVFLSL
jgi:hypothetical protein